MTSAKFKEYLEYHSSFYEKGITEYLAESILKNENIDWSLSYNKLIAYLKKNVSKKMELKALITMSNTFWDMADFRNENINQRYKEYLIAIEKHGTKDLNKERIEASIRFIDAVSDIYLAKIDKLNLI